MIGLEYVLQITGKSHTELSQDLNIKRQNINQWIKCKSNIPYKYYDVLNEIFNIPSELLQEELTKKNQIKILEIVLKQLKE